MKRFETFRNKLKQGWRKGENPRPYIFCFETLKHINYIVNQLKQIETDPKMTKSEFETFRNVSQQIETRLEKR